MTDRDIRHACHIYTARPCGAKPPRCCSGLLGFYAAPAAVLCSLEAPIPQALRPTVPNLMQTTSNNLRI